MQEFNSDIRSFPGEIGFGALTSLLRDRQLFGDSFMGSFLLGTSSVIELTFDYGFGYWFLQAIRCVFSPQILALWRLCVVTGIWLIWDQRNKIIFEGFCLRDSTLWANIWALIREFGANITATMHNSPIDLAILAACKVQGKPPKGPTVKCVRWQPPPIGVMKINVDGSAAGSPGQLTGGGIFRDHYGVFRGCFTATHGCGFAFEAELATALLAIELAHDKGWNNLWLESDSTYVVHLLKSDLPEVPWRLMARWHRVRQFRPHLHIVVSHIFREGNAVADRLPREEVSTFKWWSKSPDFLLPFLQRDISSEFYRFARLLRGSLFLVRGFYP
ncbi:hypothetical protein ACS0TY_012667 [Phlomoides rotata]